MKAGDRERIDIIQDRIALLATLRAKLGRSHPVVKDGLHQLGIFSSCACRLPLTLTLTESLPEERVQVETMIQVWEAT